MNGLTPSLAVDVWVVLAVAGAILAALAVAGRLPTGASGRLHRVVR